MRSARKERLARAHAGDLPNYPPESEAGSEWRIELPRWCADQRNQMTGPADDAELCVKMLNSGAPGVMLDLEDSMANTWEHLMLGHRNIVAALYGELTYEDAKRGGTVAIEPSATVVWNRVRGLHLAQAGVITQMPTSASLFDVALLVYTLDYDAAAPSALHLHSEIGVGRGGAAGGTTSSTRCSKPKAGAATRSARWRWSNRIRSRTRWKSSCINLREYIVGLNLGRWDYMASLIHYNFEDPRVAAARPQHDSVRRSVLPSACARSCPSSRTSTARWRSAA